jgi:predicted nucleotidyltransferase
MKRNQIVKILNDHQAEILALGVKSLALFGSVARDEAHPESDVDLLVEFSQPVGLFQFIELKQLFESLLGCPVDLATPNSLRPLYKELVIRDAIYVL